MFDPVQVLFVARHVVRFAIFLPGLTVIVFIVLDGLSFYATSASSVGGLNFQTQLHDHATNFYGGLPRRLRFHIT